MTKNHQQAQRRNSGRDRDRPHNNNAGTRRSSLHVFVVPIEKNVNTHYRKKIGVDTWQTKVTILTTTN
jgi:hypothetical protein